MANKRQVAKKCLIKQLISGSYVKTAGWDPSYILVGNEQVSIANLIGIIIDKQEKLIVIDDGTGNMAVRFFENNIIPEVNIGDSVQVIGRVSEYEGSKFITGQAVSKIAIEWLKVRKEEIKINEEIPKKEEKVQEIRDEVTHAYNIKDELIEQIKNLDPGEGVEVTTLINGNEETEKAIKSLLEEGEIFEIIPGRVKVLE